MSLCCSETGAIITYGAPLWAITRPNTNSFCALSQEVLNRIPHDERRDKPGSVAEGDVDVYSATSTPNDAFFSEVYTWSGFKLGEFKFSVSRQTMERHASSALHILDTCKTLTAH